MDRVLKLKETESIAVPAMSDYLSVGNNTADNANSNTYVYQPNKSLHQVSRYTKRQNELYSEVWKLFSQISDGVPAQLPCAMLPRQAWEISQKSQ